MTKWIERFKVYQNALAVLEEVCKSYIENKDNIIFKLAVIKAFEIVFELAWRLVRDYLKECGIGAKYPLDSLKGAYSKSMLMNYYVWLDMLEDKNEVTHSYNPTKADAIAEKIVSKYLKEFYTLLNYLKGSC